MSNYYVIHDMFDCKDYYGELSAEAHNISWKISKPDGKVAGLESQILKQHQIKV